MNMEYFTKPQLKITVTKRKESYYSVMSLGVGKFAGLDIVCRNGSNKIY